MSILREPPEENPNEVDPDDDPDDDNDDDVNGNDEEENVSGSAEDNDKADDNEESEDSSHSDEVADPDSSAGDGDYAFDLSTSTDMNADYDIGKYSEVSSSSRTDPEELLGVVGGAPAPQEHHRKLVNPFRLLRRIPGSRRFHWRRSGSYLVNPQAMYGISDEHYNKDF